MLRQCNIKHKLTLGVTSLAIPLLSVGSLAYLTFTPESAHAATDTRTLDDIDFMQEITPTICSNTPFADEGGRNQYHLKDSRDQDADGNYKEYWVAHLKDGNCWMTQNLDLDLYVNNAGRTLTPGDSDVAESWTSTSGASALWSGSTSEPNAVKYYDPGEKYCANNTTSKCDLTISTNDGHDSQGNYYSWGAATANTATSLTSDTSGELAAQSICPKGWKLPLSGDKNGSNNTISGSFKYLMDAYSIGNNTAGSTTLRSAPLYFVYSGFVSSRSLSSDGYGGHYWSSIAINSTNAYHLNFNGSSVFPSSSGISPIGAINRSYGLSVRCIARDWPKKDANIAVTIPPILTIDATSNMNETVSADGIATGTISATIIANTEYDIKLSSDQPELRNGSDTINVIAPVSTNNSSLTNNTWGIRTSGSDTSALYSPITTTPTNFLNTTSANANGDTVHTYDIGVKTAPSLPAGTYSTTVTITASTK